MTGSVQVTTARHDECQVETDDGDDAVEGGLARRVAARENERRRGAPRSSPPSREEFRARTLADRAEDERTPERAGEITMDGAPIAVQRKDYSDCTVIRFDWTDGTHVWCAGTADVIDTLALRSEDRIPYYGPDPRPPQST